MRTEEQEQAYPVFKMLLYGLVLALDDLRKPKKTVAYKDAYDFVFSDRLVKFLSNLELEDYRFCGKVPIVEAIRGVAHDKRKIKKMMETMKEIMRGDQWDTNPEADG